MKLKHGSKPFRSLEALAKSGSTTRVLNLAALHAGRAALPEYSQAPFFRAPLLNRGIVLKHRLREDDAPMLLGERTTVTKVIIPLDPANLASGGASFLVGQAGWLDLVEEMSEDKATFDYDTLLLECLDQIPSFDPFLLREHLRRRNIRPADCYFALSPGDREQMRRFVQAEIARLIELAYAGRDASETHTAKLVEILLASDTDERLEPLRVTLRLDGATYSEGIFAWRGFLYYKWALRALMDALGSVAPEIGRLEVDHSVNAELNAFVAAGRLALQQAVYERCSEVSTMLDRYDNAFVRLTEAGDALAFREFLLKSPALFLQLGERIGMISHIASFWRYRFPPGSAIRAGADEVLDLLQDFQAGLSQSDARLAA